MRKQSDGQHRCTTCVDPFTLDGACRCKPSEQRNVTRPGHVILSPSTREIVFRLARERQWSTAQTVDYIIHQWARRGWGRAERTPG